MLPPRHERTARLLGAAAVARLRAARVTVLGLGGVGGFAVEGLARAGVGHLILVDPDVFVESNGNRQLHALAGNLGTPKAAALAARVRAIDPEIVVEEHVEAYSPESAERLLTPVPDVLVDAIDTIAAKLHLLARAVAARLPLVTALGAAGRRDPTRVRVADLARTYRDPFARVLRKLLRTKYGLASTEPLGVLAVFSDEPPDTPDVPLTRRGEPRPPVVEGSVPWVPAVVGMTAAATAVRLLLTS